MRFVRHLIVIILLSSPTVVMAANHAMYPFSSPVKATQFWRLTGQLRCLVCQNENIAESLAPLAAQLRQKVYQMVLAGKSDQQVIHYLVSRYGDFVLFKPKVNAQTYLLWFGPFLLLLLAALVLILVIYRRSKHKKSLVLSATDKQRLNDILNK